MIGCTDHLPASVVLFRAGTQDQEELWRTGHPNPIEMLPESFTILARGV